MYIGKKEVDSFFFLHFLFNLNIKKKKLFFYNQFLYKLVNFILFLDLFIKKIAKVKKKMVNQKRIYCIFICVKNLENIMVNLIIILESI